MANSHQRCHPENHQHLRLYPLCDPTTPLLLFVFFSFSICRCLSVDVAIDVLDVGCLIFQALLRRAAAPQPVGRLDFYEYLMLPFFIPSLLKLQLQNSNIDAHTDTRKKKKKISSCTEDTRVELLLEALTLCIIEAGKALARRGRMCTMKE